MELLPSVREHHAQTLLIHYRWDVETISAVLVENGTDRLFTEADIPNLESRDPVSLVSTSTRMCDICMEDIPSCDITKMDCGHCFCNTCWTEHFIAKLNEGRGKRIRCMAFKCFAICDESDNKIVKWCPSTPHFGNAIRVKEDEFCEVECSCGNQFCFRCLCEAHSPCSCAMWQLWTKKCRDGSETVNWISAHTKPCPKCHKPVEKNGGCNLVCCTCGQAFCWLGGGATGRAHTWTSIAGHSCSRYKEDREKQSERAKQDLYRSRRALFYSYPFAFYMFGDELFKDEMTKEDLELKQHLFEDQQQQLKQMLRDYPRLSRNLSILSLRTKLWKFGCKSSIYL
nr:probable E3 ubiquitin-protein ligase ARI2 [Tanacetum cinerariifolium]